MLSHVTLNRESCTAEAARGAPTAAQNSNGYCGRMRLSPTGPSTYFQKSGGFPHRRPKAHKAPAHPIMPVHVFAYNSVTLLSRNSVSDRWRRTQCIFSGTCRTGVIGT
jgi:hypothetical protein